MTGFGWRTLTSFFVVALAMVAAVVRGADVYRPPAVPLVVHDPFLSIWSCADKLTDDVTRHWTKHPHSLCSIIRIDGQSFRLMGNEPAAVPAFPQISVTVLPTRTIYEFVQLPVHVTLSFVSPMLPDDIDVLSRPLTYLTWTVKLLDGKPHDVSVLFSASGELAVNSPDQIVEWSRAKCEGLTALKIGTTTQAYVKRAGDDSRIDWGYAYIAADATQSTGAISSQDSCFNSFADGGKLPADDAAQPRAVKDQLPTMALAIDFGKVAAEPVTRRAMIAYDDIYTVDFFGKKLRGYWRRDPAMNAEKLLVLANQQFDDLQGKCRQFDDSLMADITKVGGQDYAYICALAYRQSLGACGLAADTNGQPLYFTKENTSNGNMATVDVIFPMDPILIFLSPTLAKASLAPVFVYAASPRWKWPNAPHDLGEYPIAFGKDNGGEAMPVEESGNMLILADAISQEQGNTKFADAWWPQLTQWAKYLEQYGLDPEMQLCTDDFKGRLAHNANLSVKAIVALAAYGDMAKIHGDAATADKYMTMARADATHWIEADSEGDHFKLAFNKPNSWGQNYNMVWDRILGLNVFPAEVEKKQIEFFKTKLQPYGLPLDSRDHLTKTDWTLWTASMADNQADFEALTSPILGYLNGTTSRIPFVDSYVTDKIGSKGMHARPVIGGVFIRMLTDRQMWKKWAGMDHQTVGNWAPLPLPPIVKQVVPTAEKEPIVWEYTIDHPAGDWMKPGFDDSTWQKGPAGFGRGAPNTSPRTDWKTADIWLRREFEMPEGNFSNLKFYLYHDDDVEIFINGIPAGSAGGYITNYQTLDLDPSARQSLKPGKNLIAVHCHQVRGGQFIDVGLSDITER
jgi:hypothetical protein